MNLEFHSPSLVQNSAPLIRYDAACRALSDAISVDEVKEIRDQAEAMRAYARQANNKQLEIDASEIRFRAERRLGQMLTEQKATVGLNRGGGGRDTTGSRLAPVESLPTLSEVGIDKKLSSRAQQYAAIPEEQFETILSDRRERIEQENDRVTVNLIEASKHVRGTLGTGENEWYTPAEYVCAARDVLGGIDIDPASSDYAQRTVNATSFFTLESDGLSKAWNGRVWLNPPYAQPHIANFADKMVEEVAAGRVTSAVMLTHNYTDTVWFQKLASGAKAICFTRGRIRFESPTGDLAAPTQGQAFFYFGSDVDTFAARFQSIGFIARLG